MATSQDSWDRFLTELDRYVDEHGHARVPQHATTASSYPLGRKVNEARTRHSAGKLPTDRVRDLQTRPGWSWDSQHARWLDQLAQVTAHLKTHQTLTGLPQAQRQWVLRQRWAQQESRLSDEQHQLLTTVPGLLAPTSKLDLFIEAATQWLRQHPGTTMSDLTGPTTIRHQGQNIPLRDRMIYYRRRRAGLEGTHPLPDVDADRLEALPGWTWDGPRASYTTDSVESS